MLGLQVFIRKCMYVNLPLTNSLAPNECSVLSQCTVLLKGVEEEYTRPLAYDWKQSHIQRFCSSRHDDNQGNT